MGSLLHLKLTFSLLLIYMNSSFTLLIGIFLSNLKVIKDNNVALVQINSINY